MLGSEGSPVLFRWSLHSLQFREVLIWVQGEFSILRSRTVQCETFSSAEDMLGSPSYLAPICLGA